MASNYGFIGIGAMGWGMAANVRRKTPSTSTLYIYDINRLLCEKFASAFSQHGPVTIASSPKEIASNATTILSILPSAAIVRDVYLNQETGVITAPADSERLIIELSTIEVVEAQAVAEALASANRGSYIDTPVSGGSPAADAGTLSMLIGHAKVEAADPFTERIECVLSMMGSPQKFFWCGKVGAGLAAKISNNYLSCSMIIAVAEAMAIGIRSGVDPKLLYDVIHNSTGQSFMGDNVCPVPGIVPHAPSSNNWKLGFKTQMMIKDIALGVEAGNRVGIIPRFGETALNVWKKAAKDPRCMDRDGSSVWLFINDELAEEKSINVT